MNHFVLPRITYGSTGPHSTESKSIICICFVFLFATIPTVNADVVILRQSVEFSYEWGNWFLDLIRGEQQPFESLQPDFIRQLHSADFSWESYKHVEPLVKAYKGYLICLLCGFLFIVLMPFIGLIFCCCRCCGYCGGRAQPMDSKHAKCKRVFFTTSLLILNTAILLCVVLALINNQLLHETFTNKDEKINTLLQLKNSTGELERTVDTLQKKLNKPSDTSSYRAPIERSINNCVDYFCSNFQKTNTGSSLLKEADYLWQSAKAIRMLSTRIDDYRSRFNDAVNGVRAAETDVKQVISKCETDQATLCKELESMLPVRMNTQLSESLGNQIKNWANEMNQHSKDLESFFKLSQTIRNFSESAKESQKNEIQAAANYFSSSERVDAIVDQSKAMLTRVASGVTNANRVLRGDITVEYVPQEKRTVPEVVAEIDSYRMYAFVAFCCIIVLVVIFYYLGMCFGICGERPFEDASVCNGGVGANLLMAGVAFTFLFAWILMIITSGLFLFGGFYQTEACRYMAPNASYESLQKLDGYFSFMKNTMIMSGEAGSISKDEIVSVVPPLLYTCVHEDISIIQLARKTNLLSLIGVPLPQDLNFRVLETAITTNYSDYQSVASNLANRVPSLPTNMEAIISDLQSQIAMDSSSYYNFIIKASLLKESYNPNSNIRQAKINLNNLRNIAKDLNKDLNAVINLKFSLATLEGVLEKMRAPMSIREISLLKDQSIRRLLVDVFEIILTPMLNDTSCYSIGVAAQNAFSAFCVNSLRPLNGYWYGLGMCLWLMLPALIFAVKLAGLYRKIEKYSADYEEPDYISYHGFYMPPGENVPLQRKSRGNVTQPTGRGPSGKDLNRGNPNYHQLPVYSYDAYE
jgi:prominin 1